MPFLSIFLGKGPLRSMMRRSMSLLSRPLKRMSAVKSSYTVHAIAHMSIAKSAVRATRGEQSITETHDLWRTAQSKDKSEHQREGP